MNIFFLFMKHLLGSQCTQVIAAHPKSIHLKIQPQYLLQSFDTESLKDFASPSSEHVKTRHLLTGVRPSIVKAKLSPLSISGV